jgi:hypothetical protein
MMYAAAARDLWSAGDRQKRAARLQEFRAKLQARAPERERFNAGFAELHYSQDDTKAKPLVGYVLERVDRAIRGIDPPVDYRNMTIEHLSPQRPPAGTDRVPEYAALGNLILVGEPLNGKLQNRSFSEKKRILRDAGYKMDPILSKAKKWGSNQIKARTDALAKLVFDNP